MTEPNNIKMNLPKSTHIRRVRTLSDEYHSRSPDSQALIKAIAHGTSPTSKRRMSTVEILEMENKYLQSDEFGRCLMAHYGMVSSDYHEKHKNITLLEPSINSNT
jgi:hypothetical protein